MARLGRRPSGADMGVGRIDAGVVRGTIYGRPSANGWLYEFGARVGTNGGATATYYQALYGTSGGTTINELLGQSVAATARGYMDWGGAGTNQPVKPTAPIKVYSAYTYAIAIRCSSGGLAHGQDHSGWTMHDRTAGSFPNPFGATWVRPEGRSSFWFEFQPNRQPNRPGNLSPSPDAVVTTTPTLAGDFRDPDESLPGFSVGQADTVSAYRFEVWNATKTSRLQTSTKLASTSGQRAARRVTWSPSTLQAGNYVARLVVWDQFGVPSSTAEWRFTISSGGQWTSVDLQSGAWVPGAGVNRITNQDAPNMQAVWTHSDGLNATNITMRILDTSGNVVRGPNTATVTTLPNATRGVAFSNLGWSPLPKGQRYRLQARGTDTAGITSDWATSYTFTVNAPPNMPTNLHPSAGVFSTRPELTASFTDPNDDTEALTPTFQVRPVGGSSLFVLPDSVSFRDGAWRGQVTSREMGPYGTYEWRAVGEDQWGVIGAYSPWQTITYAQAPTVTITAPDDEATLTTGTPGVTWASDVAMASFRVTIRDNADDRVVLQTQTYNTSGMGGTYTVPPGLLRNDTTYRFRYDLVSTQGLAAWAEIVFSIDYPQPSALPGVTVAATPGPFEQSEPERGWSRLLVTWPQATLEQAPDANFAGYVLRRTVVATGEDEILAILPGRADIAFEDKTCASGVTYRYDVTYLRRENNLDLLESVAAFDEGTVTLVDTVLCSMDDDDIGLPLRFWEDREAELVTNDELVETWGDEPLVFVGGRQSDVIRGTWHPMDDQNHGAFLARDLIAAARQLVRRRVGNDGHEYPRLVCYRDPRGRVLMTRMHQLREIDQHVFTWSGLELTFTQVAASQGITDIAGEVA